MYVIKSTISNAVVYSCTDLVDAENYLALIDTIPSSHVISDSSVVEVDVEETVVEDILTEEIPVEESPVEEVPVSEEAFDVSE
jgi:hypothetical protein